jgi:allantoin racemase
MRNILVINPISDNQWNQTDESYLKMKAYNDTNLNVVCLDTGPKTIECSTDISYAAPEILRIINNNKDLYDGILINCFADPIVTAAREVSNIPVVGPGEASVVLASMLGHKYSIITPQKDIIPMLERNVENVGLINKLASINCLNMTVRDLEKDKDATLNCVVEAIKNTVEHNNAEVVILGCTGLIFLYSEIKGRINIPVIEPAATALKMLETLIDLRLSHSKEGLYFYPK